MEAVAVKQQAHTPGPWKIDDCDFGNIVAGTRFIARIGDEFDLDDQAEADAEFIVRACNVHDELLAALIDCADRLEHCALFGGSDKEAVAALMSNFRPIIAKAAA